MILKIVAGNRDGQFRIDPTTGVLYVARPLDAEYKSRYTLTVSALDQANTGMRKQSSARVRIFVQVSEAAISASSFDWLFKLANQFVAWIEALNVNH